MCVLSFATAPVCWQELVSLKLCAGGGFKVQFVVVLTIYPLCTGDGMSHVLAFGRLYHSVQSSSTHYGAHPMLIKAVPIDLKALQVLLAY